MTSFADPDLIACPHCGTLHERFKLLSFNDLWNTYYSDGGQLLPLHKMVGFVSRCTSCSKIIDRPCEMVRAAKIETIKVPKPTFWNKVLGTEPHFEVIKMHQHPLLPSPRLEDWLEASVQEFVSEQHRSDYEYFAMYEFNQYDAGFLDHLKSDKDFPSLEPLREKIVEIEDKIIKTAENKLDEFECLTAADIFRRRGQFDFALESLRYVHSEAYLNLKNYIIQWVNDNNMSLMAIPNRGAAGYDGNHI